MDYGGFGNYKVLETASVSKSIHVLIRDSVNVVCSLHLKVLESESKRESSSGGLCKSVLCDGSISNASIDVPVRVDDNSIHVVDLSPKCS